ncbi:MULTISPECIES: hypothetical protein [unclassified Sphingomonas]|nr:hypothetical protein [Sphingomonas sp. NIBR02145]WHU04844.1 hypothetical protein O3305_09720 [Sphingomonas sp. NIBR02145]
MSNPRIAIALLALATLVSGSAAWSTADARLSNHTPRVATRN